jgi:hypothetical protein
MQDRRLLSGQRRDRALRARALLPLTYPPIGAADKPDLDRNAGRPA